MRVARPAAASLIVLGLLAGTLGATSPSVPPRQVEGYWILAGDFHVHAFPGDGALAPWVLRREVQRAGLDVFAVTNHNQTFTARFGRWLSERSPGPIVIAGEEITARGYHLIAVGIDRTVDAGQSAEAAIEAVHAQGGVAIAAHPEGPRYTVGYSDEAVAVLDGFERAHRVLGRRPGEATAFIEFDRRARRVNPGIAAIGSSDFHATASPGICRTYVLARERSPAAVLDAIRDGRTVAADDGGNLFGDPRFVRIVEAAGGYIPPPATEDRWGTFAVAATWLGLLGLVSLGGSR